MSPPQAFATGRCACGAVQYRLQTEPLFVHCCHCRWCQRETGSAFALNAMIETARLDVAGAEPEAVPIPSESGKGQTIVRCACCRVALWSHYAGAGTEIAFVRVGTLDEPSRCPPDVHIYTESRQPWFELPRATPAFARYYRRSATWPADKLARYAALRES